MKFQISTHFSNSSFWMLLGIHLGRELWGEGAAWEHLILISTRRWFILMGHLQTQRIIIANQYTTFVSNSLLPTGAVLQIEKCLDSVEDWHMQNCRDQRNGQLGRQSVSALSLCLLTFVCSIHVHKCVHLTMNLLSTRAILITLHTTS